MSSFTFQIKDLDGESRVVMRGAITEKSDFSPLLGQTSTRVVLDLAGVERFNSVGVREWIRFIAGLFSAGREVIFERCSGPVVHQLNMISTMRGNAKIRSILLPYLCPSCQAETFIEQVFTGAQKVEETVPCSNCGKAAEFDDIPEIYQGLLYRPLS